LDLLSIPRDTEVDIPGYRFRRINEVYAYHFGVSKNIIRAAGEVMSAVNHLLGPTGAVLDPRYYLHVDYDGFRKMIDLLGGVNVHVDEPMHYDDNAGDYHMHREPGYFHMNGEEALDYVRFRGRSGDRGRILRQMEFLKSVLKRLASPLLLLQGPRLIYTITDHVHTNFSFWDLLFLGLEAKHVGPDRLNPRLLPGRPERAFWRMDHVRTSLVIEQMTGKKPALVSSEVKNDQGLTTVKVWNGSAKSGAALSLTRRLRAAGFDVLEWGNYNLRQTKTRVLDRVGDFEKAQGVARAMGVDSVFSDVNPRLRVDVEVVIGEDYNFLPESTMLE